ncbi:uncharacterized protein N7483_011533 [Penicillium malachiteum]|uniref:uncharacterized protein n=1 Tax=Penicillium malachiteum TaxID=1324776 RepID=UPI00254714A4|nr:uncharacterized protein N7483_011533 [Penicillium malachiteum]KAJ5714352.1 hypothetical protein N7483_011533 [Penicillium malachiteum]
MPSLVRFAVHTTSIKPRLTREAAVHSRKISPRMFTKQKAMAIRKVKCYDGRRSFEMDSIVIQSQPLKDFLAKVMKGYPGLTFTLTRVEFKSHFEPWDNLCQERDNIKDPKVKSHVDLLYGILKEELSDLISEISDLLKSAVMTHKLIWALFEPGKVIYSVIDDCQRAFLFLSGDFDPNPD